VRNVYEKSTEKKSEPHVKEIDGLKQEIEKLKQELNDKNDKLLRSYAIYRIIKKSSKGNGV